jgi:phosphoribosylformylglycinamidine synthase
MKDFSDMTLEIPGPLAMYRFIVRPLNPNDPRSAGYLADSHALGLDSVEEIACQDLFFIEGNLAPGDAEQLGARLLSDPLTQAIECQRLDGMRDHPFAGAENRFAVEVALHPGVTDPVAEQIVRAAQVLGFQGVARASTGQRFVVSGINLDRDQVALLASRLLANPTIQRYELGVIQPAFPQPAQASGSVEQIPIRDLNPEALAALSLDRRAALDLEEMLAIQRYYQTEQRDMTDVEFETIAQTWSEHCVHKTFKAQITLQNPGDDDSYDPGCPATIDNLLKTYLRAATDAIQAPWVRSAFVDNAGIIDFDDQYEVSFKVETHNHPSAIEPFGGANTGTGGVIRDVIGVSAKPIATTDVLCFGPPNTAFQDLPPGVLHPRRVRSGVVAGVQDYGNKIGIPTVSGALLYDPGFTANPLVFCGCVGIAPKDRHPRTPQVGDRVIIMGGRTGRDGLRGATFSSMTMDAQTGEVAGASVQIGAPIVEKGLIDVIVQARDLSLYHAVTDCGAGGLSSAVGEMASTLGAEVELEHVRLKYAGLAPWEIWLSEAQERMVLAVPPAALPQVEALCRTYAVELTDIGQFTGTGRLVVRNRGARVLDLANAFLHDGIPQRRLRAVLPERKAPGAPSLDPNCDYTQVLRSLLSHPNIASKAPVIRIYDHEVQGGTVIKPLTGAENDGPSDSVVLKPAGTAGATAIVLGAGINPEYGKRDPYRMAWAVVDEAVRNIVAAGADPDRIALLDNFCWGDPKNPVILGTLVEAVRGCHDAAVYYCAPFISGKDSLNNEYSGVDGQRHAIPPTLLISSIGVIQDYAWTVTMDLKQPGSYVYLVGAFRPCLEGSHFCLVTGCSSQDGVPAPSSQAAEVYRQLHLAIREGLVNACHDLSEGGLAVAAAEMCIGGRLGLQLALPGKSQLLALFGETIGCLLVEVPPASAARFEALFEPLPVIQLGQVLSEPVLSFTSQDAPVLSLPMAQLVVDWQTAN